MMKCFMLALFSALIYFPTSIAQAIPECSPSNSDSVSTVTEAIYALGDCNNAFNQMVGGKNLQAAINAVGLQGNFQQDDEGAIRAGTTVSHRLDAMHDAVCFQAGVAIVPTPAACPLLEAVRTVAKDLTSNGPPSRTGRELFRLSSGAGGNQLIFGPSRSVGSQIGFCRFVAKNQIRDTDGCVNFANDACDVGCRERLKASLQILPYLNALYSIADQLSYQGSIEEIANAKLSKAAWINYVHGGNGDDPSHIGELWLTEQVFGIDENVKRSVTPPNPRKMVFLRPGIGVESYESDGTKVELAGVVELIGYRQWSGWTEDGKRSNQWGASIIAAYSPSEDADDWGYGILVKTPFSGIDVSWTTRDSPTGRRDAIMFSTDLTELIPNAPSNLVCGVVKNAPGCDN